MYKNGDIYEGNFKNAILEGEGHMIFASNSDMEYQEYRGLFSNGNFSGSGKLTYVNEDIYDGHFLKGVRHGSGILTYSSYSGGLYSQFKGSFNNNFFEEGELKLKNGNIYSGQFQNNRFHGQGVYKMNSINSLQNNFYSFLN